MHPKQWMALSLPFYAALLSACATTSEGSPQPNTIIHTQYVDRAVNADLFRDDGGTIQPLPEITDESTQASAAAPTVEILAATVQHYRCKLNAAGVAMVGEEFARLPFCSETDEQ